MSNFNLSALAVKEKAVTLFLIIALFGAGVFAFISLGRAEDPLFTIKVFTVVAFWPGAKAREMQELVAEPLEKRMQELQYYDHQETFTTPGQAFIVVTLKDGTPKPEVENQFYQARKKLYDEGPKLPQGVSGPFVNDEYKDVSFALYAIKSKGMPLRKLVRQAEVIRQRLLHVPGVKKINIEGERPEKIFVEFSYPRLTGLGISARDIFNALLKQNLVTPAGSVETKGQQVLVRMDGPLDDLQKIKNTPVIAGSRSFVLSDIAEVSRGYEDPARSYIRHNGEECLLLDLFMQDVFNGLELGKSLETVTKEISSELPFGVSFERVADQAVNIKEAIDEFMLKFVVALSVVMLVSLLSMGWRVGIVVAAAIPLTLSAVFVIMMATGRFFDRISLGALILALGLLVDDAIIAIEIMVVKMEEGWDRIKAASYAWSHTAAPMLSGTLVTIISLMPVGFAKSSAGEYAGNIFWVVAFSLIASWIVAVAFTPYLGVKLLPNLKVQEGGHQAVYHTPFYNFFRTLVIFTVKQKYLTAAVVVGMFVAAIVGMGFVRKQFFPVSDRPEVLVEIIAPQGSSIDFTKNAAIKVEGWIRQQKEATSVTTYVGRGSARFFISYNPELPNPNFAKIIVLTPNAEARDKLIVRMRKAVSEGLAPATRVRVLQFVFGPFTPWPVAFRIMGPSVDKLRELADQAEDIIRKNPHTRTVNQDWGQLSRIVYFKLDQKRLNLIGLNSNEVSQQLQFLLTGYAVTQVREDIRTVDIIARALPEQRFDPSRIGDLNLTSKDGRSVPLMQIGSVEVQPEDYILKRRDRTPIITVSCDVQPGMQPPDVSAEVKKELEPFAKSLPRGYRLEEGGDTEEANKANLALAAVFPIMILLMFTVVMLQVRQFSAMFMVMLTGPLGLCGVVPILLIFNQPFGFNAILGTSALAGIIIRNTLILIDQIHINQDDGLDHFHAVVEATVQRSRPVYLTALAAVLAFMPLTQSVFWGSMAYTLIGGTAIGTLLTLTFLPALYAIWFKVKETSKGSTADHAKAVVSIALLLALIGGEPANASQGMDYEHDAARIESALHNDGSGTAQLPAKQPIAGASPGRLMPQLPERSRLISEQMLQSLKSDDELIHAHELHVQAPVLQALISVQQNLSPLTLDAKYVQPVTLKNVLDIALANNLDLGITRNNAEARHLLYRSAKGNFLPDFNASYGQYFVYGQLGLPYTRNQLFGSNTLAGNSRLLTLNFPYSLATAGGSYYLYRGGAVVFGAKQAKHEMNATRAANFSSYSDVLRDAAKSYYNLVLAETLLQIRVRAVDTAEEQVRFNGERLKQGLATNLEYLQARTQLSLDRQALLEQEVNRRLAAIELTSLVNFDRSADIKTMVPRVLPVRLVSEKMTPDDLVQLSIVNRPELKQYSELQKAAKAAIVVAGSPLHPTIQASANVIPTGRTGSNIEALLFAAVTVNWHLGGLGTIDYNRMKAAKVDARNAELEIKKQLIAVDKEVRSSFLKSSLAKQTIAETETQVDSAVEELRSARKRYELGLGTQLDVLTGQRDLTQAQINQATATIRYNNSQVELVHSIGMVSIQSLNAGSLK
jgi:multidrug efflux pump subunit AcrB/outer membrane protein TolC